MEEISETDIVSLVVLIGLLKSVLVGSKEGTDVVCTIARNQFYPRRHHVSLQKLIPDHFKKI